MSIEAMKQPEQEPVGVSYNEGVSFFKTLKHGTKLYAAPPKREWIDLTYEEIETIIADHMGLVRTVSFAIEAKLKEKNRG